jgi:hypothetical protein
MYSTSIKMKKLKEKCTSIWFIIIIFSFFVGGKVPKGKQFWNDLKIDEFYIIVINSHGIFNHLIIIVLKLWMSKVGKHVLNEKFCFIRNPAKKQQKNPQYFEWISNEFKA